MASTAAKALPKIHFWDTQELVNTAWAFAKLGVLHEPLLQATSSAALRRIGVFSPQDLVTTAWSLALLIYLDAPLINAISSRSRPNISDFRPQHLALLSWSFAILCFRDQPLINAISAESIRKISEFGLPDLTGTGIAVDVGHCQDLALPFWSFAALGIKDWPLMKALSAQSLPKMSEFGSQNLSNTSWALACL